MEDMVQELEVNMDKNLCLQTVLAEGHEEEEV